MVTANMILAKTGNLDLKLLRNCSPNKVEIRGGSQITSPKFSAPPPPPSSVDVRLFADPPTGNPKTWVRSPKRLALVFSAHLFPKNSAQKIPLSSSVTQRDKRSLTHKNVV